jgi:hypothetical protein
LFYGKEHTQRNSERTDTRIDKTVSLEKHKKAKKGDAGKKWIKNTGV